MIISLSNFADEHAFLTWCKKEAPVDNLIGQVLTNDVYSLRARTSIVSYLLGKYGKERITEDHLLILSKIRDDQRVVRRQAYNMRVKRKRKLSKSIHSRKRARYIPEDRHVVSTLFTLDADLIHHIFGWLSIGDILLVRYTCHAFRLAASVSMPTICIRKDNVLDMIDNLVSFLMESSLIQDRKPIMTIYHDLYVSIPSLKYLHDEGNYGQYTHRIREIYKRVFKVLSLWSQHVYISDIYFIIHANGTFLAEYPYDLLMRESIPHNHISGTLSLKIDAYMISTDHVERAFKIASSYPMIDTISIRGELYIYIAFLNHIVDRLITYPVHIRYIHYTYDKVISEGIRLNMEILHKKILDMYAIVNSINYSS